MNRPRSGFTLIEMALTIAIVGVFAVTAINVSRAVDAGKGGQLTKDRMVGAQRALQVYVQMYGCLPCPAEGSTPSSDATAGHALAGGAYVDLTPATLVACATYPTACDLPAGGVVPWRDIGISEEDATDAWGSRLRYAVGGTACSGSPSGMTVTQQVDTATEKGKGMVSCGSGNAPANGLNIADFDSDDPLDSGNEAVITATYVLISSGPDRSLAYPKTSGVLSPNKYSQSTTTDAQGLNSAGPTITIDGNPFPTFARASVTNRDDNTHFDDIVSPMSASTIIFKCGAGSCGNPN